MSFELDFLTRLQGSPLVNYLGLNSYEDETGEIVIECIVNENLLNLNDTLHGGVHASILDTIIGQKISQQAQSPVSTINLNIFYSSPARKNSILTARAQIVQLGYRIATAEGTITDENGTLIAKGIGSFKILRSKSEENKTSR